MQANDNYIYINNTTANQKTKAANIAAKYISTYNNLHNNRETFYYLNILDA